MIRKTGVQVQEITPAQDALAKNLRERIEGKVTPKQLAARSGVGRMTIYDMLTKKHDPSVGKVDKVARQIGLEAWSLLLPYANAEVLELITVFNSTDATGRELIRNGVAGAKQRIVKLGDNLEDTGRPAATPPLG